MYVHKLRFACSFCSHFPVDKVGRIKAGEMENWKRDFLFWVESRLGEIRGHV